MVQVCGVVLSRGTTIGYAKLDRIDPPLRVKHVQLDIEDAVSTPEDVNVKLFAPL